MRIFIMKKSLIFRVTALVVILAAIVVYAKIMVNEDAAVFSQNGVLTAGSGTEKEVALTVDTSFGEEDYTAEILDVLEKHGAKATFAVMGVWARENPDTVREILDRGHDVISHSMTHERYGDLGEEGALKDARANREYLESEFGVSTDLLRLPYGNGTEKVNAALNENGFRIVGWSLDSMDWKGEPAGTVADRVMEKIKAGDILLFQNNMAETPAAMDAILEKLGERAYATVDLEELGEPEQERDGE